MKRVSALLALALLTVGCGNRAAAPAALDPAHDMCTSCRMIVSDARMASQLVAPYEEPRFFDDLTCLTTFLKDKPALPAGAVIYVADHRTRAWVRWDEAVYTRVETLSGAMGSHVVAHASIASRDADADAAHGTPVVARDVFPPSIASGGS
jgi:copper chaperone NosL